MIWVVDFRERREGGAVVPGHLVEGDADVLRQASQVNFLLHGFNVDRTSGKSRLKRLARMLNLDGATIVVLWPGDSGVGAVSYPFEGRDADNTADHLTDFIVDALHPNAALSFFAHSLGARVVMETIGQIRSRDYAIAEVCLVAAAVDDFSVSEPTVYRSVVEGTVRVSVLASRKDKVLKYAYPAGDLLQNFLFFWREHFGLALGYHGPRAGSEGEPVPELVHYDQADERHQLDHGHYLPDGSAANTRPGRNQRAAARFARAALTGQPQPKFE